jgi:hypothetical protein
MAALPVGPEVHASKVARFRRKIVVGPRRGLQHLDRQHQS